MLDHDVWIFRFVLVPRMSRRTKLLSYEIEAVPKP